MENCNFCGEPLIATQSEYCSEACESLAMQAAVIGLLSALDRAEAALFDDALPIVDYTDSSFPN